jgi:diguanylate cyclase (GGDEF)-like protein
MADALNLLIVDDKEIIRTTLSFALEDHGYAVATATNGAEGLALYEKEHFDIVITDIYMPEMNGLELLKAIKAIDPDTQVIVMTRWVSIDTAIATLRAGAYDYVTKPFEDVEAILSVVRRAARKIQIEREAYKYIEVLNKKAGMLKSANRQLKELAHRDGLTGLYNHRFFQESLESELRRAERYKRPFSLLFIDLDYFKIYNDAHGHLSGNKLLTELSDLLRSYFRKTDVVCRFGGDEFVVILPEASKKQTRMKAAKLHEQVADHPFEGRTALPGNRVTISIGFATFPQDGGDAAALLEHADQVMFAAKKNRGRFDEPDNIYNAIGNL